MELYYTIVSFIFGTVLGSFYNVVGYRLPKGESLVTPSSHCPKCQHKLGASELVPIFSYLFQKGKCKNCKTKISPFYMIFELLTGILFAIAYLVFGSSFQFLIALVFISVSIIIIISDYQTMIIPDEVLLIGTIAILIITFISGGFIALKDSIISGLIAFFIMYSIKIFGDIAFKKESMGGGDIKLMFVFGITIGWEMAVVSILLASFIALPISLLIYYKKKESIIPFGPFLTISALFILLSQLNFDTIIKLII